MAFTPKDAIWYIAQLVLEITVEGESQNVVHVNYLLVRADSPEEAYEKALRLGSEHETTYLNQQGKRVQIVFRGLHNLTAVYEPLENGSELWYEETVGVSQKNLDSLVACKESLGVFRSIEKNPGPDYASAEIQREARRMVQELDNS
jgi:hypothetical protein